MRLILWTDQYQLSRKTKDDFVTVATTSEFYSFRKEPVRLFVHDLKEYQDMESITDFLKHYPKETLNKSEELKRYKILYLETQRGIAKVYLKPSQYVGCFLEKS